MKKIKNPSKEVQAEQIIDIKQDSFASGMSMDVPASDVPDDGMAWLYNTNDHRSDLQPRTGSRLFSNTRLPRLKTGITAAQTGRIVVSTGGPDFTAGDIGRYFCWLGDEDYCNQITGVTNANQITVRISQERGSTAGCWIRGAIHGRLFHKEIRKWIVHIDSRLFMSEATIPSWNQIYRQGTLDVIEASSNIKEDEDTAIIINSAGVFRIIVYTDEPYYFKMDSLPPENTFTNVAENDTLLFGRRYLYSYSRLTGSTYWKDRTDANVKIEAETGTCLKNVDGIDYGEVYTAWPLGMVGILYGGMPLLDNITNWKVINNGTVNVNLNGETHNFEIDCGEITSVDDLAILLQTALRRFWKETICIIQTFGATRRMAVFTGRRNGAIGWATAGTGGVDISGAGALPNLELDAAAPAAVLYGDLLTQWPTTNAFDYTNCQNEATHYTVYETKTIAEKASVRNYAAGDNYSLYVWSRDIPVISSFAASQAVFGLITIITVTEGWFYRHDIGETVVFENGVARPITNLCDAVGGIEYEIERSRYCLSSPGGVIAAQSAAIGAGAIMTITKAGRVVTLVSGTRNFVATDEGRSLFCADGSIIHITAYTNANTVTTIENGDKAQVGAGIDPQVRGFSDYENDYDLQAKIKASDTAEFSFKLGHRGFINLPYVDIGTIVPGFLIAAHRGENVKYYSSMLRKYLTGQHKPDLQYSDKCEDAIQTFLTPPNKLIVICSRETYATQTNIPVIRGEKEVGEAIAVLPELTRIAKIGCIAVKSIAEVGIGQYILLTSEPAVRKFDGSGYGENIADLRVMRIIEKTTTRAIGHYDDVGGYVLWLEQEE